jgi:rhamnosyltransferase
MLQNHAKNSTGRSQHPLIDSVRPRIAVCLAAFNGIEWLPAQLDSILAQSGVDVVVIVSVDRSSDGTEAWIDNRVCDEPRVIVLPHGEQFGGAAQNFFRLLRDFDFSGFDYVSFADQDDIWPCDKLQRAHDVLQQTGADGYSSNVTAFWPDGRNIRIEKSQPQQQWDFLFEAAGPGCTYLLRRQLACALQSLLIQKSASVNKLALHDWFTYAFARANGFHWVIDDYAGMLYRQHDRNQVGVNKGWRAAAHRVSKVLSGWGIRQAALIAELVGVDDELFVKRWTTGGGSRTSLFWLAFQAQKCRRRRRDQLLFLISCLTLSLLGKKVS